MVFCQPTLTVTLSAMSTDLKSIGLGFDRWQDAVEAAIATNELVVAGEIRGGQLIQFADASDRKSVV